MATVQRAITDEGLEIAFDESGIGRTVVWLHGMSEDRLSWAPVTEQLADEVRFVRIDFRGHGASAHRRPYELEGFLPISAQLFAQPAPSPPVVGHSLGPTYEEWFRSSNPAGTIEFWNGMGHWLHLVDPDRFAVELSPVSAKRRLQTETPSAEMVRWFASLGFH